MYRVIVLLVGLFALSKCQSIHNDVFKTCKNRQLDLLPFKVIKARSKIECAAACAREVACGASNFFRNNKECQLFTDNFKSEDCLTTGSESTATVLKKKRPSVCVHGGTWDDAKQHCGTCDQGYAGKYCERHIIDCYEGKENGQTGIVNVLIRPYYAPVPFVAKCYLTYGITEVERRGSCGSIGNFSHDWAAYRDGFGDLNCNHFIGLEKLYLLTNQRASVLKVWSWGTSSHQSFYWNFRIDSEASSYAMFYSRYTPNNTARGGDGFGLGAPTASINGTPFCTPDRDCNSCAQQSNSGWWFNTNCAEINLHVPDAKQLVWPLDEFDPTTEQIFMFRIVLSKQW